MWAHLIKKLANAAVLPEYLGLKEEARYWAGEIREQW